jgi:hypothetical protein
MKDIKLKKLEEIYEHKLISKEEYEKKKKEIEEMPEKKVKEKKEEIKETKLKSDRMLIIGAILVIVVFISIFSLKYFTKERPETIDELHKLNLEGKLKPEQGYLYNGAYSFVKYNDFWYTQLVSSSGKTKFNFNFRYSPKELEDIKIGGWLDVDKFNNATWYYATFNPLGDELAYVRLARLDYDMMMVRVFQKTPVSACDRNETTACSGIPIITCENTDDIVVYYKESEELGVEYKGNCIIISGKGLDLVKGVDRVLYNLYGIMEQ